MPSATDTTGYPSAVDDRDLMPVGEPDPPAVEQNRKVAVSDRSGRRGFAGGACWSRIGDLTLPRTNTKRAGHSDLGRPHRASGIRSVTLRTRLFLFLLGKNFRI